MVLISFEDQKTKTEIVREGKKYKARLKIEIELTPDVLERYNLPKEDFPEYLNNLDVNDIERLLKKIKADLKTY